MNKSIQSAVLVFVFLAGVLSGCAPAAVPLPPAATPTPLPTATALPTSTPVPTYTRIPPTPTLPVPDKVSEFLDGVQVTYLDPFDDPAAGGWDFGIQVVQNGVLQVTGNNWNGVVRQRDFSDNQGLLVDFSYSKGAVFEMLLDHDFWQSDIYKRFGIYMENNHPRVNVWVARNGLGGANLPGSLVPLPDTIYSLMMTVLPNGEFLGVIWDPANPSKTVFYHEKIGKDWTGLTWKFRIGADKGTILFDNFREITFTGAK